MSTQSDATVASFPRYADALATRERLVADGFPAAGTGIVGVDLAVAADRWTPAGRLAGYGVAAAVWLAGLLGGFAALVRGPVVPAALLGAGFGAVAGFLAGWWAPARPVTPGRYELRVAREHADPIRTRLLRSGPDGMTVITATPTRRAGIYSATDPRASAEDLLGLAGPGHRP
jgi:hypothetical protein